MKFGSVCSGIEAASVAWHPLGWEAAWLSEIEPFPCAVLKHHYPDVPNHGDMTLLPEKILSGEVEAPDLFCGGTPCQAFSVAGLRNSLDDARGNLSLTFVGIANAIDHVRSVRRDAPAIIFWENVPGVLNTKDNAFGCFLGALAGEDDPIIPSGEKWTNAGCVYGPQRTVAWRVLDAQYFGVAQRRRRVFVVASARTDIDPTAILFEFDGVRRDTAPSRKTGQDTADGAGECATLSCRCGYKFSEHLGAYGCPNCEGDQGPAVSTHRMVAFGEYSDDGTASAMKARDYKDATDLVARPISIHPHCIGRAPEAGPQGKEYLLDGSAYCMDGRGQPQAIAFGGDIARTLQARHDSSPCADRGMDVVAAATQVRRLTPTECERLQGFPDGYTAIPWRKKPAADCTDGPRYKALGNSWAVPVVRWIGKRIQEAINGWSTDRAFNTPKKDSK